MERTRQDDRLHETRHLLACLRRLALWGPMGSGKSTVGRILARRYDIPFIDLDDEVARSIPFDEPSFRIAERAAFRRLSTFDGILSLGGGTLVDPDAESLARTLRRVVVLRPPNHVAVARSFGKPLADSAASLLARREAAYQFWFSVVRFAEAATPDDVADAVERVLAGD